MASQEPFFALLSPVFEIDSFLRKSKIDKMFVTIMSYLSVNQSIQQIFISISQDIVFPGMHNLLFGNYTAIESMSL